MRISRILAALTALLALAAGTATPATAAPAVAQPIGGGNELIVNGQRCTASFAITDSGAGRWFLLANRDCAPYGGTAYRDGKVVGPVLGGGFPQYGRTLIEVTNRTDWVLVPYLDTGSGRIHLTGTSNPSVGAPVCMFGGTTGLRCGHVYAVNLTIVYPWGTVHNAAQTNVCGTPAEAGAPFVSGDRAQGTFLSCGGGRGYFEPIGEFLSAYGLVLFTG